MPELNSLGQFSFKCKNFKCFGDGEEGPEAIKPVNVIIGRNNSGKSTLIDSVEHLITGKSISGLGYLGNQPSIVFSEQFGERHWSKLPNDPQTLRRSNYRWSFSPRHWAQKVLEGATIQYSVEFKSNGSIDHVKIISDRDFRGDELEQLSFVHNQIRGKYRTPIAELKFRRLTPERDIRPEQFKSDIDINIDGSGFTNLIQRYLNDADLDQSLVEIDLLNELNSICSPDAHFTRILTQRENNEKWEIYLEEDSKGPVPLSRTGSGLKTILLVIGLVYLLPRIENTKLSEYVFGLEELENNLHPALLRRLFTYLADKAENANCYFFITTHSNIVIDLFSKNENAQILHVTHNGKAASVSTVKTTTHGHRILDDLDVRASDLLQANAIVWVEGPSDRIYFNQWVNLWSDGLFKEGVHYQCSIFGGSLAAHLSFDSEYNDDELIEAIKINRHAIFLADSDRGQERARLKARVKRIQKEVNDLEGYAWITKGREVENYIPHELFPILLNNENDKIPDQFERVPEFIRNNKKLKQLPDKVDLARKIVKRLTKKQLEETLDLKTNLNKVCQKLAVWNQIEWK